MAHAHTFPRRITRGALARFAYTEGKGKKGDEDYGDAEKTEMLVLGEDIEDALTTTTRKRRRVTATKGTPVKTSSSPLPSRTRIKVEEAETTEVETAASLSPVKAAPRRTRKPARATTDATTGQTTVLPPSDWAETYDIVLKMRSPGGVAANAVVDTMGCERLADLGASPKDKRFHALIALMLSSQTKDTVNAATMARLKAELPPHRPGAPPGLNLANILAVAPEELNRLIWAVGFHNNKTKFIKRAAEILRDEWDGDIPDTIAGLTALPGVGPKMAYLCMSVAWDRVEGIGVDVHVHRITNLWGWQKSNTPEETRLALQSWLPKEKWREINWLLVGFGQKVCLPVGRRCGDCELGLQGLCRSAERKKVLEGRRRRELKEEADGEVEIKGEEAEAEAKVVQVKKEELVVGEVVKEE